MSEWKKLEILTKSSCILISLLKAIFYLSWWAESSWYLSHAKLTRLIFSLSTWISRRVEAIWVILIYVKLSPEMYKKFFFRKNVSLLMKERKCDGYSYFFYLNCWEILKLCGEWIEEEKRNKLCNLCGKVSNRYIAFCHIKTYYRLNYCFSCSLTLANSPQSLVTLSSCFITIVRKCI